MDSVGARAAKIAVIALEIAGVLLAVGAACAILLYSRLQAGPISLEIFERSAELAIRQSLPHGHAVDIDHAALSSAATRGAYMMALTDIVIIDGGGAPVANLSRIDLEFSVNDLLRGRIGPRHISVIDPAFRFLRRADQSYAIESAPTGEERSVFRMLTGGDYFRGAFKSITMENVKLEFEDESSGRTWRSKSAAAKILREGTAYLADVSAIFGVDGRDAALNFRADFDGEREGVDAVFEVQDAPLGDLFQIFTGVDAVTLAAPVSGMATARLTKSGALRSARIEGSVDAGQVSFGARSVALDEAELLARFNQSTQTLEVERLAYVAGGSRGRLSGAAARADGGALIFSVSGVDLLFDTEGFLPAPLLVSRAGVEGEYFPSERRIELGAVEADFLDVSASGRASVTVQPENSGISPAIEGRIAIDGGLDPQRILLGWPTTIGLGARDFVRDRLPEATVENANLAVNLSAGSLGGGARLPDEAIVVSFDIRDATTIYAPGMTPLTAARGGARLTPNRFFISPVSGRVGDVRISKGEIDFTALHPRGEPVVFRFTAQGDAYDILAILDQEPLRVLKKTGLSADQFSGAAEARIEITRPNRRVVPRDKYEYRGAASFANLKISSFIGNEDLENARGEITLETRNMDLNATAEFKGAPLDIEWRQNFFAEDGLSTLNVAGEIGSSFGDFLRVPTRHTIVGPVRYNARAAGYLGDIRTLAIDADFTPAVISVKSLGWQKPRGASARARIDAAFRDGGVEIQSATVRGEGVDIVASGSFGPSGVINAIDVERFVLENAVDLALKAARPEVGPLEMSLTGRYLNAAPLVEAAVNARPSDDDAAIGWGEGVLISGRIDEITFRGGARYRDAALDIRRGPERIEGLSFSAMSGEGKPLSVEMQQTGEEGGPDHVIIARTDDIGSLLAGVFDIASIRGGEGSMELFSVDRSAGGFGLHGIMEARSMRVVGAPLLARIFAAGSLTGLADLLNGDGIELSNAFADFEFADGVFTLGEGRATGPSVGITGSGQIEAGEGGAVDLAGAVAPAYQVNSLLGRTPLIGDVFVNREGEGVVALSYDVAGRSDAPSVTVNPLSALTPGFLRRMFEGGGNRVKGGGVDEGARDAEPGESPTPKTDTVNQP